MRYVSNTLEFLLSEIISFSKEESIDWVNVLELSEHQPIISIAVVDDNEPDKKIVVVAWTWANEYQEVQLFKIECDDDLLKSIGRTIMAMVKAIGSHRKAQKITTSVPIKSYQWTWYQQNEVGFKEVGRKASDPPSPYLELALEQ
jgi:hypothetical protein